ncbi:hypothetical protein [Spirosoma koreense]
MTDDERKDLLELKAFLEKAILSVEDDLIITDPTLSRKDYLFLIDKVKMYRKNLTQIMELLKED